MSINGEKRAGTARATRFACAGFPHARTYERTGAAPTTQNHHHEVTKDTKKGRIMRGACKTSLRLTTGSPSMKDSDALPKAGGRGCAEPFVDEGFCKRLIKELRALRAFVVKERVFLSP